jgi:hypothetical protein
MVGLFVAALGGVAILAGCSRPLPEEGSPSADLYRRRCGTCHRPYQPSSMKYALWSMVLGRMDRRIREAGEPPLGAQERAAIESYLRRNGG